MNDSFISFLGITKKAGKCIEGYNKCEQALKSNKCFLVLISSDVSNNTKEKFLRIANNRKIPIIVDLNKEDLSYILGKSELNIVGVKDKSMADRLIQLWNSKD